VIADTNEKVGPYFYDLIEVAVGSPIVAVGNVEFSWREHGFKSFAFTVFSLGKLDLRGFEILQLKFAVEFYYCVILILIKSPSHTWQGFEQGAVDSKQGYLKVLESRVLLIGVLVKPSAELLEDTFQQLWIKESLGRRKGP
jgi:hypothetical protein